MAFWVVIDEGCQECGVESVPIGLYESEADAQAARDWAVENSEELPMSHMVYIYRFDGLGDVVKAP